MANNKHDITLSEEEFLLEEKSDGKQQPKKAEVKPKKSNTVAMYEAARHYAAHMNSDAVRYQNPLGIKFSFSGAGLPGTLNGNNVPVFQTPNVYSAMHPSANDSAALASTSAAPHAAFPRSQGFGFIPQLPMINVANSTPAPAFSADNLNQGDKGKFLQPINENTKNKKKRRGAKKPNAVNQNRGAGQVRKQSLTPMQRISGSSTPVLAKDNPNAPIIGEKNTQHENHAITPKRQHVAGETPPDFHQLNKRGKTATNAQQKRIQTAKPSMATVVADAHLTVAIVDMPVPDMIVPLTKDKYDKIYEFIDTFILQTIKTNMPCPKFDENRHTRGVMKIRCADSAAKKWLTGAIPYFGRLWEEIKLTVIDFDQLPQPKKVLGTFQNCKMSDSNILEMLGAMNACINTAYWTIVRRTISSKGVHVTFGVHEDQLAVLKSVGNILHFGAGIAKFMDISKKQNNVEPQNVEDHPMETETVIEEDNSIEVMESEKAQADAASNVMSNDDKAITTGQQTLQTSPDVAQISAPAASDEAKMEHSDLID